MIRLVADIHGAASALRSVASRGGPLLVLGDLINLVDYRTGEGIAADVSGHEIVRDFIRLRTAGDHDGATRLWRAHSAGRETALRGAYDHAIRAAYTSVCAALEECESYVTYGNVDRPDILAASLPDGSRFVDGEVVTIEGHRVGFVGGGMERIGTAGEVSEAEMDEKLGSLGPVDILCTHVAPAIDVLAGDVIGGVEKGSRAVLDYVLSAQPAFHYFGDIHQPRASRWRVGATLCRNVGYFRATGRAVRHG